jgi:hypothetical protein
LWFVAVAASGVMAAAQTPAASLEEILFRANETVIAYEKAFTHIMADEAYTQRIVSPSGEVRRSRVLDSHYLFVQVPGTESWAGFRDTFQVDGKPVRDPGAALETLADAPIEQVIREAARRALAGTTHNLGSAPRSLNVPTLALSVLHPLNQHRFEFEKTGEDSVSGIAAWKIDYSERTRPSLLRLGRGDLFARGTVWLEPGEGHVVKTVLAVGDPNMSLQVTLTTTYRLDEPLHLWVPAEMHEVYMNPRNSRDDWLEGTATYRDYRRLGSPR